MHVNAINAGNAGLGFSREKPHQVHRWYTSVSTRFYVPNFYTQFFNALKMCTQKTSVLANQQTSWR